MANIYNPIKSYPYSKNRLLVIDWASLSYHLWFAMKSKMKNSNVMEYDPDLMTSEQELAIWRTSMITRLMKYIRLFNPMDMVIALEGKNVWRNKVVIDYYNDNTNVSYDHDGYYIQYDNLLYKVTKTGGDHNPFVCTKLDINKDIGVLDTHNVCKLKDLPQRVRDMMWTIFLPNGTTPLLPKYKGKRQKMKWEFITKKNVWRDYKDDFGKAVADVFRSYAIGKNDAEGDDVIYVACNYMKEKYDSIILITGDSDMNQLLTIKNLKIYNHRADEIVVCNNPEDYLELKILQGDKSDNINGMALPEKKTQLGEKGAIKLFENTDNIFDKAKLEGWDTQYKRNQTLINLNYIPTDIQRSLCESIDSCNPTLGTMEQMYGLRVTDKTVDGLMELKNLRFYIMLDKEYVEDNLDVFNPDIFIKSEESLNNRIIQPKREFDSMDGVFESPIDGSIF